MHEEFPGARTIRWDRDTATGREAHEFILQHFADRHADILIGTQMIAKGLDLPQVTLVGIIRRTRSACQFPPGGIPSSF